MSMVRTEKLIFEYDKRDDEGNLIGKSRAIDEVDIDVKEGQFVAVLGHNGSGKSTLAKHLNAILVPSGGTVWVNGNSTSEPEKVWDIRQSAGMVFQNPDNQIIGTVVEEDVGFGPENLGVPTDEIWQRVEDSLRSVGMLEYRHHSPNKLSGGQKQRVAIAGVVAMEPKCIVLDEPTAMLDPEGRKEVLRAVEKLRKEKKVTVILITHYMEEVIDADKIYVMDHGHVVMEGTPREIFSQVDTLKSYRLDVPQATILADVLRKQGVEIPAGILSKEELVDALSKKDGLLGSEVLTESSSEETSGSEMEEEASEKRPGIIQIEHLNYVYSPGTAYERHALKDINLEIPDGEFIGVIGHTGSGKSTLIQHLNGLVQGTDGVIRYQGENIYQKGYKLKNLRQQVGLVFQYPEHQLFEIDVLTDVCFGPKTMGLSKAECEERALWALKLVGLKEKYYKVSPFELSGGQKRRVAIAGILAMKPKVLVLDEPTAGLDPKGRDDILDQISYLHKETGMTVVLVSHSMEDVARYADRIIVMNDGKVMYNDSPERVFRYYKELERVGLAAPQVRYIVHDLRKVGLPIENTRVATVEQAAEEIMKALKLKEQIR